MQAVSKLLGHSDLSITAGTYAHLQLDQVRQELSLLSDDIVGVGEPKETYHPIRQELSELSKEDKIALIAELGGSSVKVDALWSK